jgi:23S rRNA pseudouridine1911/1915/1917 synthase
MNDEDDEFEMPGEEPQEPAPLAGRHDVDVPHDQAGQRLDRVLTAHFGGAISRARIQALIREGHVCGRDGKPVTDPGAKTRPGDRITVAIPEPAPHEPAGETLPLNLVYEDAHLLVIDKPAGLVVHPAAGHAGGTLVNALIAHCGDTLSGIGGVKRPGIVHRLDKETSGLLVVAKSDAAHRGLAEQFAAHGADGRMSRTYEAFVWGTPVRHTGAIDANLARSTANRTRIAVVREPRGRHAVTHYEVLETFSGPDGRPLATRMRLVLETGRTHQIRVHLAHIGHPVMGDPVYGAGFKASARSLSADAAAALESLNRQALHAMELGFEHPVTGRAMHFTSSRPAAIEALYNALKGPETQETNPLVRGRKRKVSKA